MFYQGEIDRMINLKKDINKRFSVGYLPKEVRWRIEVDGDIEYVYDLKLWALDNGISYNNILRAAKNGVEYKGYTVSRI